MSQKLFDFIWNGETSEALAELKNNKKNVTRNINEMFKPPYGFHCTCLWLASNKGQDVVVEGIIGVVGVDVNKGGPNSLTPLHTTARNNHPTIAKLLLRAGAGCLGANGGFTPIHGAARAGHTAVLQVLLQAHSGQVNQKDGWEYTALHKAAHFGCLTAATLLIEAGADPNIKNRTNQTAYDIALNNKHDDMAKYLKDIKHLQQTPSTVVPPTHTSNLPASVPAINPLTVTKDLDKIKQPQSIIPTPHPKNTNLISITQSTELQSIKQRLNNHEKRLGNAEHHAKKSVYHGRRLDEVENRLARLEVTGDSEYTCDAIANVVKAKFMFLTDNLTAEEHTDYLYQEEALCEEDFDQIEAENGNKRKTRRMLRILLAKPSQNWATQFKDSIQRTDTTKHVYKELFSFSKQVTRL